MLDKFNFYDFLGYLLPGATVVLTLYWLGKWAFGVPFPDLGTDLGSSFLFLGLSYIVGHLVQGLGSMYEHWLNRPQPYHRLTERLLMTNADPRDADQQLAAPLKSKVIAAAKDVFEVGDEDHAAIFEQSYALMIQQNLGQLTEVYLALNGLARGMLVATALGFLAGLAIVVKQVVLIVGGGAVSYQQLMLGLIVMLVLIPVGLLFRREFDRFRGYFARSVYTNFLAWYSAQKLSGTDNPVPTPHPAGASAAGSKK